MYTVSIPRPIAHNILISKYDIDYLPLVDSEDSAYLGNYTRVLKRYPIGFDFIINMINNIHRDSVSNSNLLNRCFEEVGHDYYRMIIKAHRFRDYLQHVDGRTLRQSYTRQLFLELNRAMTLIDRGNGKELINQRPFLYEREYIEREEIGILLYRPLFEPFILQEYNKKESDGFIKIAPNLYPCLTLEKERKSSSDGSFSLENDNTLYKMNILAQLHCNGKSHSVKTNLELFYSKVIPEYTRQRGGRVIPNQSIVSIHSAIINAIESTKKRISYERHMLVNNLYLDRALGEVTFYFSKVK